MCIRDRGMVGNEDLDEELGEDEYFGFGVDAGMGCVADIQTQAAFKAYWAKRLEEDPDIDPYNDLFCDLLEENAKAYPKYQGDCGDWLNWTAVSYTHLDVYKRQVHETGRVYDADLKDISQRQEQLWEGVKEILTQLSKLS